MSDEKNDDFDKLAEYLNSKAQKNIQRIIEIIDKLKENLNIYPILQHNTEYINLINDYQSQYDNLMNDFMNLLTVLIRKDHPPFSLSHTLVEEFMDRTKKLLMKIQKTLEKTKDIKFEQDFFTTVEGKCKGCSQVLYNGQHINVLSCGHMYHIDCFKNTKQNTCLINGCKGQDTDNIKVVNSVPIKASLYVDEEEEGKSNSCSICLDRLDDDRVIVDLPHKNVNKSLEHYFHLDCITKWLQTHNTCPYCKQICDNENLMSSTMKAFLRPSSKSSSPRIKRKNKKLKKSKKKIFKFMKYNFL